MLSHYKIGRDGADYWPAKMNYNLKFYKNQQVCRCRSRDRLLCQCKNPQTKQTMHLVTGLGDEDEIGNRGQVNEKEM